jgi:hypothetical protein
MEFIVCVNNIKNAAKNTCILTSSPLGAAPPEANGLFLYIKYTHMSVLTTSVRYFIILGKNDPITNIKNTYAIKTAAIVVISFILLPPSDSNIIKYIKIFYYFLYRTHQRRDG